MIYGFRDMHGRLLQFAVQGEPIGDVCGTLTVLEESPRATPKPANAPKKSCGCTGKRGVRIRIVRWRGVRWMGVPWPVRVWRRILTRKRYRHGCGCIYKLKAAKAIIGRAVQQIRAI